MYPEASERSRGTVERLQGAVETKAPSFSRRSWIGLFLPSGACAKFSVNTEEMWYNGIIGREHRKEEKNGKTKEIPVDE